MNEPTIYSLAYMQAQFAVEVIKTIFQKVTSK